MEYMQIAGRQPMIEVTHYPDPGAAQPMSAQAYLSRALTLDGEINCKLEQLARLKSRLTSCTRMLSDMPTGSTPADWTDTVARVVELENEMNADINRLIDLKREIGATISAVPDPMQRQLLELRYLCGWGWQRIADKLHYARETVCRMHRRALDELVFVRAGADSGREAQADSEAFFPKFD